MNEWLDRLAPGAEVVPALGTVGFPLGERGPVVCLPGCPSHPDNISEVLLYLLHQTAGIAPPIPLDEQLRPRWLFEHRPHTAS